MGVTTSATHTIVAAVRVSARRRKPARVATARAATAAARESSVTTSTECATLAQRRGGEPPLINQAAASAGEAAGEISQIDLIDPAVEDLRGEGVPTDLVEHQPHAVNDEASGEEVAAHDAGAPPSP